MKTFFFRFRCLPKYSVLDGFRSKDFDDKLNGWMPALSTFEESKNKIDNALNFYYVFRYYYANSIEECARFVQFKTEIQYRMFVGVCLFSAPVYRLQSVLNYGKIGLF